MSRTPDTSADLEREIAAILASRAARRKARTTWPASKLEPHAAALRQMQLRGVSQREMVRWLAGRGCTVSQQTVGRYLARLAQRSEQLP